MTRNSLKDLMKFVALAGIVGGSAAGASLGCAAGDDDGDTQGFGNGGATATSTVAATGGAGGAASSASVGTGTGGGGGEDLVSEVYGHSADVLYKLDPQSKAVQQIGTFGGCDPVVDIAIDGNHNIVAASNNALYVVNKLNGQCTLIGSGNYPNSLSYVPIGTVDSTKEALVGYQGATYVRIDPATGSVSNIGDLNAGQYESSGDIVSVEGGSTYLTVRGGSCDDCLVEVNPSTGAMVKDWGPVGHQSVYGLAFWGGSAYGFNNDGDLFEIHFSSNGTSVATTPITVPNAPTDLSFWGAGSSTKAPVVSPN